MPDEIFQTKRISLLRHVRAGELFGQLIGLFMDDQGMSDVFDLVASLVSRKASTK